MGIGGGGHEEVSPQSTERMCWRPVGDDSG